MYSRSNNFYSVCIFTYLVHDYCSRVRVVGKKDTIADSKSLAIHKVVPTKGVQDLLSTLLVPFPVPHHLHELIEIDLSIAVGVDLGHMIFAFRNPGMRGKKTM